MKSSLTSAVRSISAGVIWASFALLVYFAFGANDKDKPTALTAPAGKEKEVVDLGCGEEIEVPAAGIRLSAQKEMGRTLIEWSDKPVDIGLLKSIKKVVGIHPSINNELMADLRFAIDSALLDGQPLSAFVLYSSQDDGATWHAHKNTKIDSIGQYLYLDDVAHFSLWTAAPLMTSAPGGVANGLTYWFDAGEGLGGNTNDHTSWIDKQSGLLTTKFGAGAVESFPGDKQSNFNPYLKFPSNANFGADNIDRVALGPLHTTFAVAQKEANIDGFYNFPVRFANDIDGFGQILYGIGTGLSGVNHFPSMFYWLDGGTANRLNTNQIVKNDSLVLYGGRVNALSGGNNKDVSINGNNVSFSDNITTTFYASYNKFLLGGNAYGMQGRIPEAVYYNRGLTDEERDKVNSYLAIKYGLTLEHDYLASTGNVIYQVDSYNRGIAGIGRDDASGLEQKQSSAANNGLVTIYHGTYGFDNLPENNSSNSKTFLSDRSFLIWGHNGLDTDYGMGYDPSPFGYTPITNYSIMDRVWKVQETGAVDEVTISGPSNATHLLVSTDPSFASGVTLLLLEGGTASYNFSEGEYFTFGIDKQAPGCVNTDLELWLKADAGTSAATDGGLVSTWQDQYVFNHTHTQANPGLQPVYKENAFNFNPALYFDGADLLHTPAFATGEEAVHAFVVSRVDDSNWRTLYGFRRDLTHVHWLSNGGFGMEPSVRIDGINSFPNLGKGVNYAVSSFLMPKNGDPSTIHWNGTAATFTGDPDYTFNQILMGVGSDLAEDGGLSESMFGDIAEVIVYKTGTPTVKGGTLSTQNIEKIESYLGIKYGITLTHDYYAGDGTTVYELGSYGENVAGIGRDDCQGLNQKQSTAIEGDVVTIYKGEFDVAELPLSNQSNDSTFQEDKTFLIWGHNGQSSNYSISYDPTPQGYTPVSSYSIMSRTWKLQQSGNAGVVTIQGPSNAEHMLVSTDPTFSSGVSLVELSEGVASYTFTEPLQYFTFGIDEKAPGCLASNLHLWLKADAGVGAQSDGGGVPQWQDQFVYNRTHNATNTANPPSWKENAFNFNPSVNFDGSGGFSTAAFAEGEEAVHVFTVSRVGDTNWRTLYSFARDQTHVHWLNNGGFGTEPSVRLAGENQFPNLGLGTQYALASFILPKDGSGSLVSWNGDARNIAGRTSYPFNTTLMSLGTDIADNGGDSDVMLGDIAEVVVYKTGTPSMKGGALSIADIQKIETYLAIKYGITLAHDYVAVDGTTIYDVSSYANHIAVIGRDDCQDLHQKQSTAIEGDVVTFYIGGGYGDNLPVSNRSNSNDVPQDQAFMAWGSSAGSTLFDQSFPAASFGYDPLGNYLRMERAWRVQKTAGIDTVTVEGPSGSSHLLVSNDPSFASGVSMLPLDYGRGEVVLEDGQYFTFGSDIVAPGCVAAGLQVWLDAAVSLNGDSANLSGWTDRYSGLELTRYSGSNGLVKSFSGDSSTNYNPYVLFPSDAHFTALVDPAELGRLHTTFAVAQKDANINGVYNWPVRFSFGEAGGSAIRFGLGTHSNFPGLFYDGGGGINDRRNEDLTVADGRLSLLGARINSLVSGGNKEISFNGTTKIYSDNMTGDLYPYFMVGGSIWGMQGRLPEVVYYNRALSNEERERVNTYMAIKYGLTLAHPYRKGDGAVVFDPAGFPNRITAVGRENCQALFQKQSRSTMPGAEVTIGVANQIAVNNEAHTGEQHNEEFIVFGDDGVETWTAPDFSTLCYTPEFMDNMYDRRWKLTETGDADTMKLRVPVTLFENNADYSNYAVFLVVGTTSNLEADLEVSFVRGEVRGSYVDFSYDFPADSTMYFSFAGTAPVGMCEACTGGVQYFYPGQAFGYTLDPNAGPTQDSAFQLAVGGAANMTASFTSEFPENTEYFPQLFPSQYGHQWLRFIRVDNTVGEESTATFKASFNKSALVAFEIAGITDYALQREEVEIIGFCGGEAVPGAVQISHKLRNDFYNTYEISGSKVTSKARWVGDYPHPWNTVLVETLKPVDEVRVVWKILERQFLYFDYLFIGNMTMSCPILPSCYNDEEVFAYLQFDQEAYTTCDTATMKLIMRNEGCDPQRIDLQAALPNGATFVEGTFQTVVDSADLGTVTYGNTLNWDGFLLPVGRSIATVQIVADNAINAEGVQAVYDIQGGTQGALSDAWSDEAGCNAVPLTFTVNQAQELPDVEVNFNRYCYSDSAEVSYTLTLNNTTGNTLYPVNMDVSLGDRFTVLPGSVLYSDAGMSANLDYVSNDADGLGVLTLYNLNIPPGESTIKLRGLANASDTTAVVMVELYGDVTSGCGLANGKSVTTELPYGCYCEPIVENMCTGGPQYVSPAKAFGYTCGSSEPQGLNEAMIASNGGEADITATFEVGFPENTEYYPVCYPRQWGDWLQIVRYDNTTGPESEVAFSASFSKPNKPVFPIGSINDFVFQSELVKIKGYLNGQEVFDAFRLSTKVPENDLYIDTYGSYELLPDGSGAQGDFWYWEVPYRYSVMQVEFIEAVDSVVVGWEIEDRYYSFPYYNHLYIGEMMLNCQYVPACPNADDVFMDVAFNKESFISCDTATMFIRLINQSCDTHQVSIETPLPTGAAYVEGSFNFDVLGSGSLNSYGGTDQLQWSNFDLPPGEYLGQVDMVFSQGIDSALVQSDFSIAGGSTGQSDDFGGGGCQPVPLTVLFEEVPEIPAVEVKADRFCYSSEDTVRYTLTFDNSTGAPAEPINLSIGLGQQFELLPGSIDFSNSGVMTGGADYGNSAGAASQKLDFYNLVIPDGLSSITFEANAGLSDTTVTVEVMVMGSLETSCGVNAAETYELELPFGCFCEPLPEDVCEASKTFRWNSPDNTPVYWDYGKRTETRMYAEDGQEIQVSITDANNNLYNADYPVGRFWREHLEIARQHTQSNSGEILTTLTFEDPAAGASFEIFDIDEYVGGKDKLTITGYLGNVPVYPQLTVSNPTALQVSGVNENTVAATVQPWDLNNRARTFVTFSSAVDQITISYELEKDREAATFNDVRIGNIDVRCTPIAPKAPTPDNVFLFKEVLGGPQQKTDEPFAYQFTMINYNCDTSIVQLADQLPAGLSWVDSSLSIDLAYEMANAYGSSANFTLSNLAVPPGKHTFYLDAVAANPGTFDNQASFMVNGNTYLSDDPGLPGEADPATVVVEANTPLAGLTIVKYTDKATACQNEAVLYSFDIQNPNADTVEVDFMDNLPVSADGGMTYVVNTLTGQGDASVNNYAGTGALSIVGLKVPPMGTTTLTVVVNTNSFTSMDSGAGENLAVNQAQITPSAASGYRQVPQLSNEVTVEITCENQDVLPPGLNTLTQGDTLVTGTGEPGASVTVTLPDGSMPTATVQSDSTWSVPTQAPLQEGEQVSATQQTEGGTSLPATTTVQPLPVTPVPVVNPITAGETMVTGTGVPGATIAVQLPGGGTQTATVQPDSTWSVTAPVPLEQGDTVSVVQTVDGIDSETIQVTVAERDGIELVARVFLGGAYDEATGLMNDSLRSKGLIPDQQPYSGISGLTYTGTETVASDTVFDKTGGNAIVDWVLVELRDGNAPSTVLSTRAAFVQRDGDIVDVDGVSDLYYPEMGKGDYYVAVRHRNHLGVMSHIAYTFGNLPVEVDFTQTSTGNYQLSGPTGTAFAQMEIGGARVLWPGNTSAESANGSHTGNRVIFQGPAAESEAVYFRVLLDAMNNMFLPVFIATDAYDRTDANMDGKVIYQGDSSDADLAFFTVFMYPANTGVLPVYVVFEQIP